MGNSLKALLKVAFNNLSAMMIICVQPANAVRICTSNSFSLSKIPRRLARVCRSLELPVNTWQLPLAPGCYLWEHLQEAFREQFTRR